MKPSPEKYAKKRLTRMRAHLKSYDRIPDAELLHQVRVEIKRIKALLALLQYHDNKFNADKAYLPFRDIFRACYAIREPAVMSEFSKKFSKQKGKQSGTDKVTIKKFRKQIPRFLETVDKKGRKLLRKIKKVSPGTLERYLKRQKETLKKKLSRSIHSHDLHKTRKQVKEIMYLETIALEREDRNPFFAEVAELIGTWHDRMVYIDKLRKNKPQPMEEISVLRAENSKDLRTLRALIYRDFITISEQQAISKVKGK